MKKSLRLLTLLSAALLAGCSQMPPSEYNGRTLVERNIQQLSNGLIRLVSFQKTDGVLGEVLGVKTYTLSYKATIAFNDNCMWGDTAMGRFGGHFYAAKPNPYNVYLDAGGFFAKGAAGQTTEVSGALNFQKTERGWKCLEYPDDPSAASSANVSQSTMERNMADKAILDNARKLAAGADQFYLENGVSVVDFSALVGPTSYVKTLNIVAGEHYPDQFIQGTTITVEGVGGTRTITYSP